MNSIRHLFYMILLYLAALPSYAGIGKNDYHQILDLIQQTYQPIFTAQNQRLQITKYWESDALSATAWKHEDSNGEVSVIQISGGIARHPKITEDGFALIACQTIGHHLAGPPLIWKFSVEGQADYFGASSCLRQLLPLMEKPADPDLASSEDAAHICNENIKDGKAQELCVRILNAGISLAHFYAAKEDKAMPSLLSPDQSIANGVLHDSISPQCRLDNYVAAALCDHSENSGVPEEQRWLCQGDSRPACWHNP